MKIQPMQSTISSNIYSSKTPNGFAELLTQAISSADQPQASKSLVVNPYRHMNLPDSVYVSFQDATKALGYDLDDQEQLTTRLTFLFALIIHADKAGSDEIDWTQAFAGVANRAGDALSKESIKEARGWFEEAIYDPKFDLYYLDDAEKIAWIDNQIELYKEREKAKIGIAEYMVKNYVSADNKP